MHTRTPQWLLSSTCLAALLLTVDTGTAQTANQPVLRPGVVLPPGSVVLGPAPGGPAIVDPASGQPQAGRAHTNVKLFVPRGGYPQVNPYRVPPPYVGPPSPGMLNETPLSIACDYGLVPRTLGCNPNFMTTADIPTGGSKAIAIVDAGSNATIVADLNVFRGQFHLSPANFTIINPVSPYTTCTSGTAPPSAGWELEINLDVEYAFAMAPSAHIYLVQAATNTFGDLLNAVAVATKCVQAAGGGQVSMSWGGNEFSGETSYDSYFMGTNVTYLAAAGDYSGVSWPSTSPYVIAVGGTVIARDQQNGNFTGEMPWYNQDFYADFNEALGTGGGFSAYEARPSYQNNIVSAVGAARGVPDVAANAAVASGVWVYSTIGCGGWCIVGGTSEATPVFAGILNHYSFFPSSSLNALTMIYTLAASGSPIVPGLTLTPKNTGVCGRPGSPGYPFSIGPGFDPQHSKAIYGFTWTFCSGWGTPADAGNPDVLQAAQ
jgi:kumamolisin